MTYLAYYQSTKSIKINSLPNQCRQYSTHMTNLTIFEPNKSAYIFAQEQMSYGALKNTARNSATIYTIHSLLLLVCAVEADRRAGALISTGDAFQIVYFLVCLLLKCLMKDVFVEEVQTMSFTA